MFMSRLFAGLPGTAADHEPSPIMNGSVMLALQHGDSGPASQEYWVHKSVNLRRPATGHAVYCECNHIFLKSFWRFALDDFGQRAHILHLRRDAVEVARSMAQLSLIPGTPLGNEWYLDWRSPRNQVRVADLLEDQGEFGNDFFRCLWYWYEIEARIERLLRPAVPPESIVPLFWKGKISAEAVLKALDRLQLNYDADAVRRLCRERVNEQRQRKERSGTPAIPLGEASEMAKAFVTALEQRLGQLPGR